MADPAHSEPVPEGAAPLPPTPLDPGQLHRAIDQLGPPPVGIVLISMQAKTDRVDVGETSAPIDLDVTDSATTVPTAAGGVNTVSDAGDVVDAAARYLADHIRSPDVLAIDADGRIVVARSGLRAPSATDGLAYNLYDELSRTTIIGDRAVRWQATIGAATSLGGDSGSEVLSYADRALDEAHLLGGDRVVVFDDIDRSLLPDG